MSKSGNTEELVTLVPFAKAKGATTIALTGSKTSQLAQICDMHVLLPLGGEVPVFSRSTGQSRETPPVTSNALQMLFGDTLAVALMDAKGLTKEEYALNHPAGRIGKRLVLRVRDVMRPLDRLPLVKPTENGLHALGTLSSEWTFR
eukprot:scaffold1172_cov409-Prasinococcus_capsulatus_cf.AAC.9